MSHYTHFAPLVALASLTMMITAARAAGIYQCTQTDGSITLSDTACPPDTLTREYRGEATANGRAQSPDKDPWSVMNQVRRLEAREAAERKAARSHDQDRPGGSRPARDQRERKLSYQEARRRALEATGYSDDAHLSRAQRERVNDEMGRYGQSLRDPSQAATGRARKRGSQSANRDPDRAASDGSVRSETADPRNASLRHNPR
jgi:hypothetical protein